MGIKFQNKLITGPDGCKREKETKERQPKLLWSPPYYALGIDQSPLILQGLKKCAPST
jgi:hypothetical protein